MSDQPQSAQNVTPEELEAAIAAAKAQAAQEAVPTATAAPEQTAAAPAAPSPVTSSAPTAGFASQEADLQKADGRPEAASPASTGVQPFVEPDLSSAALSPELANLELLDDVDLDVKIELGRTQMFIEDVLRLGPGSVVPLDKLAGDPVDIYVNDRLVARGEVLVLNDNFCVRINDILSPTPELEAGV